MSQSRELELELELRALHSERPAGEDAKPMDAEVVSADGGRDLPPNRWIIVVTIAMFMGYAILVVFQHKLKAREHIADDSSATSHLFSTAVSLLYMFNLIFRLAHNAVFFFLSPLQRVVVSVAFMMTALVIISIGIFGFGWTSLFWVFLSYGLGGVGIGTFESNVLMAITPLGERTKLWAVMGFPIGFACILLGGFMLTAIGVPPSAIYGIVLCALIAALVVFQLRIRPLLAEPKRSNSGSILGVGAGAYDQLVDESPSHTIGRGRGHEQEVQEEESLTKFIADMRYWQQWFPQIMWHCVAMMVSMFSITLLVGLMLYIYNGSRVPLFGDGNGPSLPHDWFFVFYNCHSVAGDMIARRWAYSRPRDKLISPMRFTVLTAAGVLLCVSKIGVLAPPGIFLTFFAIGSIYATTARFIDANIPRRFNLVALSMWLLIGDVGSVLGSSLIAPIHDWLCADPAQYEYVCQLQS